QVGRQLDGRDRALLAELRRVVDDHAAAPAVHRGVDVREATGDQVGVAAARAEADHADLPAGVRLGAQEAHRARDVPDDLDVGHAPLGAGAGGEVVRAAGPQPRVEVEADRGVAVLGELAHRLAGPLVPA